jgi:hypothetical protein
VLQVIFRKLSVVKAQTHTITDGESFNVTTCVDSDDLIVGQLDLVDGNHGGLLAIPYIINLH